MGIEGFSGKGGSQCSAISSVSLSVLSEEHRMTANVAQVFTKSESESSWHEDGILGEGMFGEDVCAG